LNPLYHRLQHQINMAPATTLSRYGGWLPAHREITRGFLDGIGDLPRSGNMSHVESVAEFERKIKEDPEMLALFDQIFLQASESENPIKSFKEFLFALDKIVVVAPKCHFATEDGKEIREPIGVPIYILFDLLSNTSAGYDLFRKPAFNVVLKELLDSWGKFLMSNESNHTLTDEKDGWFGDFGLEQLEANDRGKFDATYHCPNPTSVNRGYASWDAFFTRKFQENVRPVDFADDKSLIHSACESTVYRIEKNVQAHDQFWLKGQRYSLYDMLAGAGQEYVPQFVGGTVYQAFLSPVDYHRWHSPIDGTIVKIVILPGTYYAVLPDDGAESNDPDLEAGDPRGALIRSQAWLTTASARALIFIQADNADIGLVCFIGVGMAEVSTCDVTVTETQKVKTGHELGMFHFGGSSHTLIFGPHVNVTFADHVQQDVHLKLNSIIGKAEKK